MEYMNLEHPSITRTLLTGYPDIQQEEQPFDEDRAYEENRKGNWVGGY